MSKPKNKIYNLYKCLSKLETSDEVRRFLGDLCTPQEIEAMADRWLAAQMVNDGVPYRKISEQTGVSTATVTRVARALSYGEGGYQMMLKKHKGSGKAKGETCD